MSNSQRAASGADDEATLAHLGYSQQLKRSLGFLSMFTVSFSVISVTSGIFTNIAFGYSNFGPASIWTWPVVLAGVLIVSLILAELGSRIPIAGIGYQWVARLTNPGLGWVSAVILFASYTLAIGGVTLFLIAPLIADLFGFDASNTAHMVLLSVGILIVVAVLNILSVRITARVNNISLATELVGTLVLGVTLLIAVLVSHRAPHTISYLFSTSNPNHNAGLYGFALAALMSVFTLEGMESAGDLGEEAVGVRSSVPRAILGSVLISGIVGMITLICITLAIPDLNKTASSAAPIAYITSYWLGGTASKIFLVFIIYSVFAVIVVCVASMARLIFSMARDNMLPGSTGLMKVNERTKTPVAAITLVVSAFIIVLLVAAKFPGTYAILIGSTPLLAYLYYLIIAVSYAIRRRKVSHIPTAFSLGKWAAPVFVVAIVYLVTVIGILTIPSAFHPSFKTAVIVIGLAVVYYFAWLRRKIKLGQAGSSLLAKPDLPDPSLTEEGVG